MVRHIFEQSVTMSKNVAGRRKRRHLQEYFDTNYGCLATPNHRSVAKDRKIPRSTHRLQKQPHPSPKKHSPLFHRRSKLEQSLNREYDTPSRDHDQMDFIFKNKLKNNKNTVIQRVNECLTANLLDQAISLLRCNQKSDQTWQLSYLLGICYIFKTEYQEAINIFSTLLRAKPNKNIYLLLSVCYKKCEEYEQTQTILDQCIRRFPKYYQAYIYRGKLHLKLKHHRKALLDFQRALSLDSHKQIGLIGKGDCLRLMEKYEEARNIYSQAHNAKKNNSSVLLRRAICNMELKKHEQGIQDINKLLLHEADNSQALYFKGLMMSKLKQQNEAIICYEQAIKYNTNKRAVTRSIYELTKLKIEARDYYQALYTLQRAQHLDIDERVIQKFKVFTDGVTSLMRKNFAQGVTILTDLMNDPSKPLSNFLKPLFYSARSYGYLAQDKQQLAKEDLDEMEKEFALDLPSLYNKFICQGVLACNAQKYEQALALFSKAGKALPNRIDPAYYKAVTLVNFATTLIPKDLKDKRKEYIENAMRAVDKVHHMPIQNNPSLYLVRAILRYATADLPSALDDLEEYWKQNPSPNPLIPYLIGLIFSESGRLHDAVSQFSRALQHDEKNQLPQAYLARAKAQLLVGDINAGFLDLQLYMSHRPSSPDVHIWAGHLLFYIGAYEDAAKAYSNVSKIQGQLDVLRYRGAAYLAGKDVLNCIQNYKAILQACTACSTNKVQSIRFDLAMLQALQSASEDGHVRDAMREARLHITAFDGIFKEADYEFYQGVTYFYESRYQQANTCFQKALQLTEQYIEQNTSTDQFLVDFYKMQFSNRAFNYFQGVYNIVITLVMSGCLPQATQTLEYLIEKCPEGGSKDHFNWLMSALKGEGGGRQTKAPFPTTNRLCDMFPSVHLPLSNKMEVRLYFCLPYVARPDITPRFDEKILEELRMGKIEIKPEAPWIRRSEEGIILTDQVIKCDFELSESEEKEEEDDEDEEEEEEEEEEEKEDSVEDFNKFRMRMKEELKLGDSVQKRLAKLERIQ